MLVHNKMTNDLPNYYFGLEVYYIISNNTFKDFSQ